MPKADHRLLIELDGCGMRAAADELERLVRAEHAPPAGSDHRLHEVLESDLGLPLDVIADRCARPPISR